jgi:hypothetical protein
MSNVWLFCLFFCRLKINHVSHEFLLDFGTVANNTDDLPVGHPENDALGLDDL